MPSLKKHKSVSTIWVFVVGTTGTTSANVCCMAHGRHCAEPRRHAVTFSFRMQLPQWTAWDCCAAAFLCISLYIYISFYNNMWQYIYIHIYIYIYIHVLIDRYIEKKQHKSHKTSYIYCEFFMAITCNLCLPLCVSLVLYVVTMAT